MNELDDRVQWLEKNISPPNCEHEHNSDCHTDLAEYHERIRKQYGKEEQRQGEER